MFFAHSVINRYQTALGFEQEIIRDRNDVTVKVYDSAGRHGKFPEPSTLVLLTLGLLGLVACGRRRGMTVNRTYAR